MQPGEVVFLPAALKDLDSFSPERRLDILERIYESDPEKIQVRKISGKEPPLFRWRIGDYRILFRLASGKIIIHRIIHRKDLEKALKRFR